MKLTRRTFIQLTGAVGLAGCAGEAEPGDLEDFDAGPDPEFDANPLDLDVPLADPDAGTPEDVAQAIDAAAPEDVAQAEDVGAPEDVPPTLDAGRDAGVDVPRDTGRDVGVDTGVRVDAGRDAGRDAGTPAPNPDPRRLPERAASFPLGVMAGDATDTSVMFWTRYDGTAALSLRVLEMDGARIVAVRFDGRVTPAAGGYVRAIVNGLRPNREHLYAFVVGPAAVPTGRSPLGRVRTAHAASDLRPILFGGTACTNQRHRPFPVLQQAGTRDDLDFFLHCGDHTYTDSGDNAVTLAQYRGKYAENWSSAGLRGLHRSTGMYLTWDDHEVLNNWDPENFPAARLNAARQAFFEHRATRRNSAEPNRLWRSFRWGRTAEVFVLDCRSERRPSTRSTNPARPSQYISRAQMDWLKAGLRASPCVFKFVVNSVPIVDRSGATSDNWNGYASQRREILNHIVNNNLRGVVWLSGDVHFGGVCRVEATGPWRDIWEVIMGPSGADRDSRPVTPAAQWPVVVHGVHNYTQLRADPTTRTLTVDFLNAAGNRIPNSRWVHRV